MPADGEAAGVDLLQRQRRRVELVAPRGARHQGQGGAQRQSAEARATPGAGALPSPAAPRSDSDRRSPAPPGRSPACARRRASRRAGACAARPRSAARRRRRSPRRAAAPFRSRTSLPCPTGRLAMTAARAGPTRSRSSSAVRLPPTIGPSQRPRIGAALQSQLVFFARGRRRLLGPGEGDRAVVVAARRLVETPVRGEPLIELGRGRLARRSPDGGAGAHAIGEDRPDRRVVAIEALAQRLPIERLLALPGAERLVQLGGAGRALVTVPETPRHVRLHAGRDDDDPRIPDDQPMGDEQQRAHHEEVDDRLGEEPRRRGASTALGGELTIVSAADTGEPLYSSRSARSSARRSSNRRPNRSGAVPAPDGSAVSRADRTATTARA